MRLTKVSIRNFRSFWSEDDDVPSAELDLVEGVNYLAGVNNAGKSNVLRALQLALAPDAGFDTEADLPQGKPWTAVELEFVTDPDPSGPVKKLLEEVDAYEHTIAGFQPPSLASQRIVRFHVGASRWGREEFFLTRGSYEKGQVRGRNNLRQRAVERFHDIVRFVDIKSGEDLQALLARGFKEILGSAVADEHRKEMKQAEEARAAYVDALGHVLRPVALHVQDRIRRYVRDIHEVDLVPNVPAVADAIADARVMIEDAVKTPLDQKGTGVRGAMLLLLLSFIAESSKSAVVFGIEEPEAFLHPEAHRELGAGLERFTQRNDVSLLVTTHSPFLFRSGNDGGPSAVFMVTKDENGRSCVRRSQATEARTGLFGSVDVPSLLEALEKVPEKAKLLLVVEGVTDRDYLRLASEKLGIPLDDMHVLPRGGAAGAVLEAVALAGRYAPGRAVAALFDSDDKGNEAFKLLAETFRWQNRTGERLHALTCRQWLKDTNVPVEVEDLLGYETLQRFLDEPGHADFLTEKIKRSDKIGGWHIGLSGPGKLALVKWLEENGTTATLEPLRPVLVFLRELVTG